MHLPDGHCFHCGLPIAGSAWLRSGQGGAERRFCCAGCQAVHDAIVAAGHEDFYRHRDGTGWRPVDREALAGLQERLCLFNDPALQARFVRSGEDWKEAALILEEIHCPACLWLNERRLRQLDGVLAVDMDYIGQQARVRWDPQRIELADILQAIAAIGYVAHPFDPHQRNALLREQRQRGVRRILFALLLGMIVMQFSLSTYFLGGPGPDGQYALWERIGRWTSLLLTALLLAYPGQLFFRNAWRDLRRGRVGMDVPIALGLGLAWLVSLRATVGGHGEVYFESIAMFVLFMLVARHVELRARLRGAAALDRLQRVVPETATRLTADGEESVPVTELRPGDRIRVRPGEAVPVDGRIVAGHSGFDESLLSGESRPVARGEGTVVAGGAINTQQPVTLVVLRPFAESAQSRIGDLTRQALGDRPAHVELANRIAGHFVAGVLAVAAGTFAFWWWANPAVAWSSTVAVLIVTCPCALALASPIAATLSAAGLARRQILPLRMSALETLAVADTLVVDKTGTLTAGRVSLEQIVTHGMTRAEALGIAAALERDSTHPLAEALRRQAGEVATHAAQVRHHPGQGVSGRIDGREWRLGSLAFVTGEASPAADEAAPAVMQVFLAREGQVMAEFHFSDPLRPGAQAFIRALRGLGIYHVAMLSGDRPAHVRHVAGRLGIAEAHGGLSPADKLAWVQQRQAAGQRVVMLGDGINDAPVLAGADVSISLAEATCLAQVHSDFIVLDGRLDTLGEAFRLARRTRAIVRQNLAWAITYNLLAVPLAAAGLVAPWGAALGMTASSLVVVANSLRLDRDRPQQREWRHGGPVVLAPGKTT